MPLLLAKLWSVIPRLFAWPPVASAAQAIERGSIALLVASAVFEFATGVINAQNYYAFGFSFVPAHYYGAVIFVASMAVHIVVKLPVMLRASRERGCRAAARGPRARGPSRPIPTAWWRRPGGADDHPPRACSRFVGAGSALLLLVNVGETIGGPLRRLSLLAPRSGDPGPGPNGFQVNKTRQGSRRRRRDDGADYRLALRSGGRELRLSRDDLLAHEQRTATLPIACVEGWTTTQRWTGVPLARFAALAGAGDAGELHVESLQQSGTFRQVTLTRAQFTDDRALLALKVNGADLSADHGFPARIIVPALPGVHNTKWVAALTFRGAV